MKEFFSEFDFYTHCSFKVNVCIRKYKKKKKTIKRKPLFLFQMFKGIEPVGKLARIC